MYVDLAVVGLKVFIFDTFTTLTNLQQGFNVSIGGISRRVGKVGVARIGNGHLTVVGTVCLLPIFCHKERRECCAAASFTALANFLHRSEL
jgi:hypothetical protein